MPHYFFDIRTPSGIMCTDYQGLDCPDAVAALREARHGAGFVEIGECTRNPTLLGYEFVVADANHRVLFSVPFTDLELGDEGRSRSGSVCRI